MQKKLGQKKFYEKLLKLDPPLKGKINPTDSQRSIRAYEVKKFTKISLSGIPLSIRYCFKILLVVLGYT